MALFLGWVASIAAAYWTPFALALGLARVTEHFGLGQRYIPGIEMAVMGLAGSTVGLAIVDRFARRQTPFLVAVVSFLSLYDIALSISGGSAWMVNAIKIAILATAFPYFVYIMFYRERRAAGPAQPGRPAPRWMYYLTPRGRAGREEFWMNFVLPLVLVIAGDYAYGKIKPSYSGPLVVYWAMVVPASVLIVVWLSAVGMARRMRDHNLPGWIWPALWAMLVAIAGAIGVLAETRPSESTMIGIAALVVLLAMGCAAVAQLIQLGILAGSPGLNRFGPYPLQTNRQGWWAWQGLAVLIGLPFVLCLPFASLHLDHDVGAAMHADLGLTRSALRTGEVTGTPSRSLDVLFIGNSYTAGNDMPGMLLQIAKSDPRNTVRLQVQSLICGGATLHDFLASGSAQKMIRSRHWDYVIFQEQSDWALRPDGIDSANQAIPALVHDIVKAGARPVFFVTWARKPGSDSYPQEDGIDMRSAGYMQRTLDTQSVRLAKQTGADTVMVGDLWAKAEEADDSLDLYLGDGSHPDMAGTYLTALAFFRYLTGGVPTDATFAPDGVRPEKVHELRAAAAE
jgi:uncharacterized membrane protein YhaH (DUF805 family)